MALLPGFWFVRLDVGMTGYKYQQAIIDGLEDLCGPVKPVAKDPTSNPETCATEGLLLAV